MGHDKEKEKSQENYRFLNETIKQEPINKKKVLKKIAAIMGSGMLFGCCAAVSCIGMFRIMPESFGVMPKEDLRIMTPPPEQTESSQRETIEWRKETSGTAISLLEKYEDIYKEVFQISKDARKALVTVKGISEDQDLLDDSKLSSGSTCSEGVIFWETDSLIYVLTCGNQQDYAEDVNDVEITFSDGSIAGGRICREDEQTGLLVAKVEKSRLNIKTIKALSVLDLGKCNSAPKLQPVIAIGCPTGDEDSVVYGMITSVSGKMRVADAEYSILATDMHGSTEGSGVLLDVSGNVIGILTSQGMKKAGTIRALPITQIRPLIEQLTNEELVNYTGVYGTGVTQSQAAMMNIPQGVYVEKVDQNSPAMTAGIQGGDVIRSVNGENVRNMQAYSELLQTLKPGEVAVFTVSRRSAEGRYIEREFIVKIDER